ncbi:uncharacterized protein LOC104905004 [Beta vulgaris subsp. vulgaris]|uniref:uncharacterized protein LOC104905004 n=1 Tax=Beta vulgaris subsp. vulgaris TaxID=3555 RepID=UPI002036F8EC|nr:uncharacterized protein LOC104905004 [Beta vulgaris subsp. vulgaris]
MAKVIGIHRNTLFLVFLAIFIFSDAVQGLTQVCDRPSRNHVGSCPDHKTCRDACMAEPDGRIFAGVCQTTTSVSQSDFTECVKNRMSQHFGGAIANRGDCSSLVVDDDERACEKILDDVEEDCRTENTVNTGDRCTCSYIC